MSELYDSVDHNNLNFEYVGLTKNVNFYGYMDSKELFNAIKNNQIKFSAVKNKDNTFSNKLKNLKAKKLMNKENLLIILINLTSLEKELLIILDAIWK